ncbi:hypothetical protein GP475_08675 [Corynebacterium poyangense]|uniref:Uncharacterized protein n=1 Tax=Corynebacterium poyangense TaxID=2684405 RepID=A0A7H0SQ77_9CORY|nr:hypothetical protein [Corynebacterium poyangense]QNQ90702.1 hypothetical protein GP475_08675 [Corynebacterium poyangense]
MTTATTAQINYINSLRASRTLPDMDIAAKNIELCLDSVARNAVASQATAIRAQLKEEGLRPLCDRERYDARFEELYAPVFDAAKDTMRARLESLAAEEAKKITFAMTVDLGTITKAEASKIIGMLKAPVMIFAVNGEQLGVRGILFGIDPQLFTLD